MHDGIISYKSTKSLLNAFNFKEGVRLNFAFSRFNNMLLITQSFPVVNDRLPSLGMAENVCVTIVFATMPHTYK